MNIELTSLEAGSLIVFTMAILGMVMALRLRKIRKKKHDVKQEKDWKEGKAKVTEEYEFKTNPETLAPEKVPKEQPSQEQVPENPKQEKPKHDVDALLDDLKKDSEK
tara:strand:- start:291 stop:611 length:321 start_codon:yes stop_codon:yes gene_type:complete